MLVHHARDLLRLGALDHLGRPFRTSRGNFEAPRVFFDVVALEVRHGDRFVLGDLVDAHVRAFQLGVQIDFFVLIFGDGEGDNAQDQDD